MSIKRLPPEAVETFTLVLHPKRSYSARLPGQPIPVADDVLITEGTDPLLIESGDYLTTEA